MCPECSGQLIRDNDTDETVCSECGLVVSEQTIDRGPEWRTLDFEQGATVSRVGLPTTQQMHDKGLITNIGWRDRDDHGILLSVRQRRKLSRLRTWDEPLRTQNSKDRNLKWVLGEIDRMASALGVSGLTWETASATDEHSKRTCCPVGRLSRLLSRHAPTVSGGTRLLCEPHRSPARGTYLVSL